GGAAYPEKSVASKTADFLAAMGINAVRFHFLDSDWGAEKTIFQSDTNTTRVLNPVQLDKLDFFVSELKKKGIYSNFNLNVGRNFREGDNVPSYEYLGLAKAVTLFDDHIFELQKEYAKQLLTHKNSYTGNEYRNEPALAFIEIVNENSLVEAWFTGRLLGEHNSVKTSTWTDIPVYYGNELTTKYNNWLKKNLSENELKELRAELNLKQGDPVPRLKNTEFENAPDFQFHTEARFIIEKENAFYTGMYDFLKKEVKVNQLVAANSDHNHWKSGYALLSSTSKLDFVDGHVYWQHPNYFTDPETGENTFSIENTPMVNDPTFSTVAQLSRSAVEGKPYTISETNHPYPNEYAAEGFVILGAYALFQDWDGIYFYTFEHDDPQQWKTKKPNYFDIVHDPAKMASIAAGAPMFHRGDLQPAETMVLRNYNENDLIEGIRKNLGPKPFFTPGFPLATPLKYKTRIHSFKGGENNFIEIDDTKPIVSETGELVWDAGNENGLVQINTPKTQALIGFSEKMKSMPTQNLTANLKNEFASVVLTSLDDKPINTANKMLLTVASTSILTGAKWNDERTSLTEWGKQPFAITPVSGQIRLSGMSNSGEYKITPLDGRGKPTGELKIVKSENNTLNFEIGKSPTVWYVIEKI
ncbi:MAG TPA: hypothetical protein VKA10_03840, partial [Prolixibacteraceae bacterium]|nr:hypothetical protein [Prolixibacteraceae bacterium]